MSNFWQRSITGAIFVAILVFAILWNKYSIAALLFVVSLIGLNEFYNITRTNKTRISKKLTLSVGAFTYLIIAGIRVFDLPSYALTLCILLASVFLVAELFRQEKRPVTNIAYSIFGIIYIIIPFALLNYIPNLATGESRSKLLLLGFFVSLWANDTGAYVIGRSFGRTKLFERISPNKTWEGFAGGLIFAAVTGYIFSIYEPTLSSLEWVIFSLLIGVFGTLGDLVESMMKRNYKVKDSGNILPGHGGILDRFDGIFLACPIIFLYLEFITKL